MRRMLKVLMGAMLALLPFAAGATPPLPVPAMDSPVLVEVPVDGRLLKLPVLPRGLAVEHAAPLPGSPGGADGIVTELRMSRSPGGLPPFQSKFPSSTTTVYAVFKYQAGDPGQLLRVEVAYQHFVTGTAVIFTHTDVYTGTGTASITIPVGMAFPGQSQFPIGSYATSVYSTPDGGQTWEPAIGPSLWQVVIKPRDPFYEGFQWNLNNTGADRRTPDADVDAPEAWGITTGRSDIVIAVVGGGVYLGAHEDLQSKLWVNPGEIPDNDLDDDGNGYVDDVHGYDFTDEGQLERPAGANATFVAGIAAAATDNGKGIAGVSWGARIMSVKALRLFCSAPEGCGLRAYPEWAVEGIRYAVDNGARIIVLGFYSEIQDWNVIESLRRTVEYAHEHGALVVASAGDLGAGSPILYPAALPHAMAVSGTDSSDRRVQTSSCGEWVSVAAPASGVIGTLPCVNPYYCQWDEVPYGQTDFWSTQSVYAAAHVAGLAALVWSVNPELTVDQVRAIIEGTADKVDAATYPYGPDGRNNCYGYGRISAERALLATSHALRLLTPLDAELRPLITYLADDGTTTPLCYTMTNPNTGTLTWHASTDADWLSLDGPAGWTPSHVEACASSSAFVERGTYHATITASSTLTTPAEDRTIIPVTFVYADTIRRQYLPLILKEARAP